jgi:hypothetical protein
MRVGSRSLAATIRRSEAEVLAEGDDSQLAASLDGVIDEFRAVDDPQGLAVTLAVLAGAELGSGAAGSAASHSAEGLVIARKHGYNEIRWRHLTLLAWAAAILGETEQATRLLGAVEATVERSGGKIGLGQGNATDRERVRAMAKATLGSDRYSALYAEGRGIPEGDAETLALSLAVRWEGPASSA